MVEDRPFIGASGSGHKIVLGAAFGSEGGSSGPSPMELVLIGLGGCSGYDVSVLYRKQNSRFARDEACVSPHRSRPRLNFVVVPHGWCLLSELLKQILKFFSSGCFGEHRTLACR